MTHLIIYIILCVALIALLIMGSVNRKKARHRQREADRKALELEALLYHSRENEKRFRDEVTSRNDFYAQLLGRLNHEIRTPMNGITGMSTMLKQTALTTEQTGFVKSILRCSTDLMNALNNIFVTAGAGVRNETNAEKNTKEARVISIDHLSEEFASAYPLRILVAEDDPMNQQMALMILKRLGYGSEIASNGQEVLEIVSEKKFDLILMDVQMPHMDGLEATRMIRLCLASQPVIIAMTANALEGDREKCIASGMNDYISKPVHIEALVAKLQHWAEEVRTG